MAFLDHEGLVHLWNHIIARLNTKVEIEDGKGLSTNDYTDEEKNKLVDVADGLISLESLVGDTSVSDQIAAANIIYVGPNKPTDANIKVWINTVEEGAETVPIIPKMASIVLHANAWTGESSPYSQVVEVDAASIASKIDLHPTATQMVDLQNEDVALMAENNNGTVTIYSFGNKPSSDMTIQAILTEVSYV